LCARVLREHPGKRKLNGVEAMTIRLKMTPALLGAFLLAGTPRAGRASLGVPLATVTY
jgi:hypothetical protein